MSSRNVVLTERQEALIDTLVRSGRYHDADDVMQEGLRLLEDQEALRAQVEEGRASGLSDEDGESVLDRLDAKYRAAAAPPR
jgi:antitoxin ParD1/3/4